MFYKITATVDNGREEPIVEADSEDEAEKIYMDWSDQWGVTPTVVSVKQIEDDYDGEHL